MFLRAPHRPRSEQILIWRERAASWAAGSPLSHRNHTLSFWLLCVSLGSHALWVPWNSVLGGHHQSNTPTGARGTADWRVVTNFTVTTAQRWTRLRALLSVSVTAGSPACDSSPARLEPVPALTTALAHGFSTLGPSCSRSDRLRPSWVLPPLPGASRTGPSSVPCVRDHSVSTRPPFQLTQILRCWNYENVFFCLFWGELSVSWSFYDTDFPVTQSLQIPRVIPALLPVAQTSRLSSGCVHPDVCRIRPSKRPDISSPATRLLSQTPAYLPPSRHHARSFRQSQRLPLLLNPLNRPFKYFYTFISIIFENDCPCFCLYIKTVLLP